MSLFARIIPFSVTVCVCCQPVRAAHTSHIHYCVMYRFAAAAVCVALCQHQQNSMAHPALVNSKHCAHSNRRRRRRTTTICLCAANKYTYTKFHTFYININIKREYKNIKIIKWSKKKRKKNKNSAHQNRIYNTIYLLAQCAQHRNQILRTQFDRIFYVWKKNKSKSTRAKEQREKEHILFIVK